MDIEPHQPNPEEAPPGMSATKCDNKRTHNCEQCAYYDYDGDCSETFKCCAKNRKDGVDVYFIRKPSGGPICHYDDPRLLAQLAHTMYAHKDDRCIIGRPNGEVVERVYGTNQIARKGRLVRVSIQWDDDPTEPA